MIWYTVSYVKFFDSQEIVYERILLQFFRHDAFHVRVSQRSQKLFFHKIMNVYSHSSFIYNGIQAVQKIYVPWDPS